MRLPPNSRKWLEKGRCLWCGEPYFLHKDGEHWKKHWLLYASSYDSTLSEKQQRLVDDYAKKTDEAHHRTREGLIETILDGKTVSRRVRTEYGITDREIELRRKI